jgi:hypothetical protein
MPQPKPTPANEPGADLSEIELLRQQVARQNELIQQLTAQNEAQAKDASGFGAYVVYTPVPTYSGKTAGIQFRNGMALIPFGEGSAEKARVLGEEFHYRVQMVDDWRQAPGANDLSTRLADMM